MNPRRYMERLDRSLSSPNLSHDYESNLTNELLDEN